MSSPKSLLNGHQRAHVLTARNATGPLFHMGQVQCVEVLLRAGASPDSRCDGTPALSLAVCHGLHPGKGQAALRMVELLLQHGAQPFDMDDGGRTALHWAAVAQLLPVVQLLLAVGLDAQQKHAAAVTAAAAAAAAALRPDSGGGGEAGGRGGGRDEEAALLPAQLPCLAEVQDADGNTALHLAARFSDPGSAPLVQFLLQPGQGWEPAALAKQRNREGDAALHLAVRHNRPAAVHALLGLGRLLDRKQRGPTELARIRGHRVGRRQGARGQGPGGRGQGAGARGQGEWEGFQRGIGEGF
ncbi:ankyrin repeat-containing domain protein [Haematococcus lacustris]